MDKDLHSLGRLLKALADPTRLRIVGLLQDGEVCVCQIHDSLEIAQSKASRHLAYLRRAGVVTTDKRGLWVYYRLAPQPQAAAQALLDAARHCVTHAVTARRDVTRLEGQTGCCVTVAAAPGLPCCASARGAEHRSPDLSNGQESHLLIDRPHHLAHLG